MLIKTLFDKETLDGKLKAGWGLSFLVDNRFLLDTGEKGEWLMENIKDLKVNIADIEAIIISHDHWDHWGGLWDMLERRNGIKVYICPRFGDGFKKKVREFKAELIEEKDFLEIFKDIYITGQADGAFDGSYIAEHALVIRTENGLSVITGCAHPGIVKMLDMVTRKFPDEKIYAVMGGFHLADEDEQTIGNIVETLKKMGVKKVYPTHCSGKNAVKIFEEAYGKDFGKIIVGQELEV